VGRGDEDRRLVYARPHPILAYAVEAEAEGDAAAEEAERVHAPLAPAPERRGFQLLVRLAGGDDCGQADGGEQQEGHRDQAEGRDKEGAQGDLERFVRR